MIPLSLSYFNQSGLVRILHLRVPVKIQKKQTVHSNLFYVTAITIPGIQTETADTSAKVSTETESRLLVLDKSIHSKCHS